MPANTPYTRYFLARILQFQFHRALAKAAGLHGAAASLLDLRQQGSRAKLEGDAGDGRVEPWPDALEALTGERQMDASAMAEYFAPLRRGSTSRTAGKQSGW